MTAPLAQAPMPGRSNAAAHGLSEMTGLMEVPLAQLRPHPLNRKHASDAKLAELAVSIAKSGILTPLLVRPLGGHYQILAGHRRLAAAQRAQVAQAPCLVRELNDAEALEVLIIENLQREDVHPLEEAEGYVALLKEGGYDIAKLAERVGRSTKYVYDRIKLLQLTSEAKALFFEGKITAGHAILLARLAPKDQARAIASERAGNGRIEGLFCPDAGDDELGLDGEVKPVSVREFQKWIDDHVRFDPAARDVPDLFPTTAAALADAQAMRLKVVHITHDYRVADEARLDGIRTYGEQAWKRADGSKGAKGCPHAVLGVVVAGPGRGEAFQVCVAKDKCALHWAKEQQERARRTKLGQGGGRPDRAKWEREEAARKVAELAKHAERARWVKAKPKLLEALAAALKTAPANANSPLGRELIGFCKDFRNSPVSKLASPGRTAEDLVRYCGLLIAAWEMSQEWSAATDWPKLLKPHGVDARKLVDQVAPQTSAPPKASRKQGAAR